MTDEELQRVEELEQPDGAAIKALLEWLGAEGPGGILPSELMRERIRAMKTLRKEEETTEGAKRGRKDKGQR